MPKLIQIDINNDISYRKTQKFLEKLRRLNWRVRTHDKPTRALGTRTSNIDIVIHKDFEDK